MSKIASHEPFGHLQPKLWAKEKPRVKLAIWLPTTKSRESTWLQRLQKECNRALESSWRKLRDCFRPHPNRRSEQEVMDAQSPKSPTRDPGQFREGGGFPRVWVVMSQVSPRSPVACPNTKRVQNEF